MSDIWPFRFGLGCVLRWDSFCLAIDLAIIVITIIIIVVLPDLLRLCIRLLFLVHLCGFDDGGGSRVRVVIHFVVVG